MMKKLLFALVLLNLTLSYSQSLGGFTIGEKYDDDDLYTNVTLFGMDGSLILNTTDDGKVKVMYFSTNYKDEYSFSKSDLNKFRSSIEENYKIKFKLAKKSQLNKIVTEILTASKGKFIIYATFDLKDLDKVTSLSFTIRDESPNEDTYKEVKKANNSHNLEVQIERGLIKSYTESRYNIKKIEKYGETTIKKETGYKATNHYDKNGRLTLRIFYSKDGSIFGRTINKYNDADNYFIHTQYTDGKFDSKEKVYTNDNGIVLYQIDISSHSSKLEKIKKKYNEEGKLIEVILYKDDNIDYKLKLKYNVNGDIIEELRIYYNSFALKSKYDNEGNTIEIVEYDSDGALRKRHEYKYNDEEIVKAYEYYSSGIKSSETDYNNNGDRVVEKVYDDYGDFSSENKNRYDYEYDSQGNWIKKTKNIKSTLSYFDGRTEVTERVIEYY